MFGTPGLTLFLVIPNQRCGRKWEMFGKSSQILRKLEFRSSPVYIYKTKSQRHYNDYNIKSTKVQK